MKAHDLARVLMSGPDLEVVIHTVNGFEPIESIETETTNTMVTPRSVFDASILKFKQAEDQKYEIMEGENENPCVMLISESFGAV